jgi:hypothetical protein
MVAEAALWGLIGASALVVGAEVAFAFHLSSKIIGLIMAFGVGALISSISFELVLPALETTGAIQVTLGLLIGALVFFVGDLLIERLGGKGRKSSDGPCRLSLLEYGREVNRVTRPVTKVGVLDDEAGAQEKSVVSVFRPGLLPIRLQDLGHRIVAGWQIHKPIVTLAAGESRTEDAVVTL